MKIVQFPSGSFTIQTPNGDVMHSAIGAEVESREVYLKQAQIQERFTTATRFGGPLVLFDIGMGIGANSVTVLNTALADATQPRVHVVSFENDLQGLELALTRTSDAFTFLKPWENAIAEMLTRGRWDSEDKRFTWELKRGDFRESLLQADLPKAHLVFFDMYTPAEHGKLWGHEAFSRIRKHSVDAHEGGCRLISYSAATRVRAAMMTAGFHVGYGSATPLKSESTVAATDLSLLEKPLDDRWWQRFTCSARGVPDDWKGTWEQVRDQIKPMLGFSPNA